MHTNTVTHKNSGSGQKTKTVTHNLRLETKSDSREKLRIETSETFQIGQLHKFQEHTHALLRAKIPSCDTLDSTNLYVLSCVDDCVCHVIFDPPTMNLSTAFVA